MHYPAPSNHRVKKMIISQPVSASAMRCLHSSFCKLLSFSLVVIGFPNQSPFTLLHFTYSQGMKTFVQEMLPPAAKDIPPSKRLPLITNEDALLDSNQKFLHEGTIARNRVSRWEQICCICVCVCVYMCMCVCACVCSHICKWIRSHLCYLKTHRLLIHTNNKFVGIPRAAWWSMAFNYKLGEQAESRSHRGWRVYCKYEK